jgi:hypothetical protein
LQLVLLESGRDELPVPLMVGAVLEQQAAVEMPAEHRLPSALRRKIAGLVEEDEFVRLRPDQLDVPAAAGAEAMDGPIILQHPPAEAERVQDRLRQYSEQRQPSPGGYRGEIAAPHPREILRQRLRLRAMGDWRQE